MTFQLALFLSVAVLGVQASQLCAYVFDNSPLDLNPVDPSLSAASSWMTCQTNLTIPYLRVRVSSSILPQQYDHWYDLTATNQQDLFGSHGGVLSTDKMTWFQNVFNQVPACATSFPVPSTGQRTVYLQNNVNNKGGAVRWFDVATPSSALCNPGTVGEWDMGLYSMPSDGQHGCLHNPKQITPWVAVACGNWGNLGARFEVWIEDELPPEVQPSASRGQETLCGFAHTDGIESAATSKLRLNLHPTDPTLNSADSWYSCNRVNSSSAFIKARVWSTKTGFEVDTEWLFSLRNESGALFDFQQRGFFDQTDTTGKIRLRLHNGVYTEWGSDSPITDKTDFAFSLTLYEEDPGITTYDTFMGQKPINDCSSYVPAQIRIQSPHSHYSGSLFWYQIVPFMAFPCGRAENMGLNMALYLVEPEFLTLEQTSPCSVDKVSGDVTLSWDAADGFGSANGRAIFEASEEMLSYQATNLPPGLFLDTASGSLTGTVPRAHTRDVFQIQLSFSSSSDPAAQSVVSSFSAAEICHLPDRFVQSTRPTDLARWCSARQWK